MAIADVTPVDLRSRSIAYFSLRIEVFSHRGPERPSPSASVTLAVSYSVVPVYPSQMASSLAAQLAQSTSLNAALLNPNRRRPTESYLFPAKEAAQHDLDAIYAIGNNGFSQLMSLDPSLRQFERSLFSDAAKNTDRTLLNAEANEELNKQIASLLPLLGPFLLDAPTGRVIEWLVRRFRCVLTS